MPAATIQVTSIELVIANLPTSKRTSGLSGSGRCSSAPRRAPVPRAKAAARSPPHAKNARASRISNEKRRRIKFKGWQQRPDVSRRCGGRGSGAHHTRGACVAHTKARFIAMTRDFREIFSAVRPDTRLFRRNLLGESRLDRPVCGPHRSSARRQGNGFVVVGLELPDLLALLEIRGDRFTGRARPFRERRSGERTRFFIAVASASKSRSSTKSPPRPSSTASGIPPCRVARTARPVDIASRMELGMPS